MYLLWAFLWLLIVGAMVYPTELIWVEGMATGEKSTPRIIHRTILKTKPITEYAGDWVPKAALVPCICPHNQCPKHTATNLDGPAPTNTSLPMQAEPDHNFAYIK